MANSITFKVKVEKDGNLKVVAKEASAAAKSTDDLSKSTDRATKSRNRFHKAEKGVGQAGLSSAKGFSKMNQTMGGSSGLVAAYATLAANIFALTAAFGALSRAAQVEKLKDGMVAMGQASGIAMNHLSRGLIETTGHAISMEEAMRTTAQVTSAGFGADTIERLGNVARIASQALGRDLNDSMQRITRGAVKMEPELLDEIGIMVRLDEATGRYADSVNKSADDLTNFEKRQAFMNAVLEEGERKFAAMADVEVNPYAVLAATFSDLTTKLINLVNEGLKPVVTLLGGSGTLLVSAMLIFASTVGKMTAPAVGLLVGKLGQLSAANADAAVKQAMLIGAQGKGSKKMQELKNDLAKGKIETDKWASGIAGAKRSVIGYQVALTKNMKTLGQYDAKTRASVIALKQAKIEHYSLVKAKLALDIANIKNSATNSVTTLQTQGLIAGMKVLKGEIWGIAGATFAAAKGMGFLAGTMVALRGGIAILTTAFAALGTAVMISLNVIGLLIAAGYAVKMAWEWFMDRNKGKKELALESAIERSNLALDDLTTNLQEVDSAFDGTSNKITTLSARYTALNNIMSTTQHEFRRLNKAQAEADKETGTARTTASESQMEFVKKLLDGSEHLTAKFKELGPEVYTALMNGDVAASALTATMEELFEWSDATNKRFAGFADSIKALGDPMDAFFASFKTKTSADEMVAGLDDLVKYMDNFGGKTSEEFVTAFSENASPAMDKLLGIQRDLNGEIILGEGGYEALAANIKKGIPDLQTAFREQQKQERLNKNNLKTLKAELKLHQSRKLIAGESSKVWEKTREINQADRNTLQQRINMLDIALKTDKDNKDIISEKKMLQSQINVLLEQNLTLTDKEIMAAEESLRIAEQKQKGMKQAIKLLGDMLKAQQAIINLEESSARLEMERANRQNVLKGYRSKLSEFQILQAMVGEEKEYYKLVYENGKLERVKAKDKGDLLTRQKQVALDEATLKKVQNDMEWEILGLKMSLLKLEFRKLHEERENIKKKQNPKYEIKPFEEASVPGLKVIDAIMENKEVWKQMQDQAADAVAQGIINGIDSAYEKQKEKVEEILRSGGGGGTLSERFRNFSEAGGAEWLKDDDVAVSKKVEAIKGLTQPLVDQLAKLGPQGALISSVVEGAFVMTQAYMRMAETINSAKGPAASAEKSVAALTALSATIGQFGNIYAAASANKVAGIDKEIEAEKKRDGKSKESLAKIQALEKKKEAQKRKAFEMNKKLQMAQVVISTAIGMITALAPPPLGLGPLFGPVLAGMVAAMGAASLAMIAGTSYQGGGSSSAGASTPSSVSVGSRQSKSDLATSKSARGELAYFRGDQGVGGAENFRGAFYGKRHRAMGGTTGYVVGEQGPELFMPDRPGTIMPADDTAEMTGGASNVTFNISAVDAAGVEEVLTRQQGHIISMLRTAANSYGEEFMEEIDDQVLTPHQGFISRY